MFEPPGDIDLPLWRQLGGEIEISGRDISRMIAGVHGCDTRQGLGAPVEIGGIIPRADLIGVAAMLERPTKSSAAEAETQSVTGRVRSRLLVHCELLNVEI